MLRKFFVAIIFRLTAPLRLWLAYWHGRGEAWQYEYYRCAYCHGIVTHVGIRAGGCRCLGNRLSPAILSKKEKLGLIITPWRYNKKPNF